MKPLGPVTLEFLLRCYYSQVDRHEALSLVLLDFVVDCKNEDILKDIDGHLRTTEKANVWIRKILATPMPKQMWV